MVVGCRRKVVGPGALLLAAVSLAGCGGSKFDFASVSGQILLDGKPVENARVVFMPTASGKDGEAGPYSNGETDEQGRYKLESATEKSTKGAVVGFHRIIVSTRRSHLDPTNPDIEIVDVEESIPFPYYDYRRTPLEFEVTPEGSDSANFSLQSNSPPR